MKEAQGLLSLGFCFDRSDRRRGYFFDEFFSFVSLFASCVALLAFLYALFLVGRILLYGIDVPGYASLMVVVLFLGGIQLITLGVLGEYLGRIYAETKRRPLYIVRDYYGIETQYGIEPRRRG